MGLGRSRASGPIVLGLLALIAGACTTTGAAKPASATSTTLSKGTIVFENGGVVTVAVPRLPTNFNPSTPGGANEVTTMVMQNVWPQPFVVGSNDQAVLGPGLLVQAEPTSVSPQTVQYTISPAARWSDGVQITAADFVYNWQQQLVVGPSLPAIDDYAGYTDIKSITSSDNGKLVNVVFYKPYADWEALFTNLVPAHIGEKYGWAAAFAGFDPKKVVSGGPFVITKFDPGRDLVLSRNPSYGGKPAHLSEIIFKVVHGETATIAALQTAVRSTSPNLTPSRRSMRWSRRATASWRARCSRPSRCSWRSTSPPR